MKATDLRQLPPLARAAVEHRGTVTIDLPFPPSVNRAVRSGRGRRHRSHEYERFRESAARAALAQGVRPFDGPVDVVIYLFMPKGGGDSDNRTKPLLDSLNGIAWKDDRQIRNVAVQRREEARRCAVTIYPAT